MKSLHELGEAGLLELLARRWTAKSREVLVGVGDDCAVLRSGTKGRQLLFKTDIVVEGVHFSAAAAPALIGRKALARALSDIAAMGGKPIAAVVTLGVPPTESPRRLRAIYGGLERTAKEYGVHLVGGETTKARQLFLNVALLGDCRGYPAVLRSGARARDQLFVTGQLGGTQTSRHLNFPPRLAEGAWLARQRMASSMMDLSDGLGADLPRLAAASRLSFAVDFPSIPRARGVSTYAACNDGEDYELLFTVNPLRVERLKKMWPFVTPLHSIGSMQSLTSESQHAHFPAHGFDHFKQR